MDDSTKAAFVKKLKETQMRYSAIGIDMDMTEKKKRFKSACISSSRYSYQSDRRYNLEDGFVHVGDADTHNPYNKAEESWTTYYAGPAGCDWAQQVLEALDVPKDKFMVLKPQRIVSVEWRPRLSEAVLSNDSDDEY